MKKIIIIGAGDFGKEVAWLIEEINKKVPTYNLIGYLDDDKNKIGKTFNGYPCLGAVENLNNLNNLNNDVCAVIANQNGSVRKKIASLFPNFNNWENIIHPSVNISHTATIGKGCIICASGNISVDTVIGDFCLFNISVTVGHDCIIKDYVSIMSGSCISGHVQVGEGAYLATNSTVIPFMKIGEYAKVGAGSVVMRNVKPNITVMGVPAKILRF